MTKDLCNAYYDCYVLKVEREKILLREKSVLTKQGRLTNLQVLYGAALVTVLLLFFPAFLLQGGIDIEPFTVLKNVRWIVFLCFCAIFLFPTALTCLLVFGQSGKWRTLFLILLFPVQCLSIGLFNIYWPYFKAFML